MIDGLNIPASNQHARRHCRANHQVATRGEWQTARAAFVSFDITVQKHRYATQTEAWCGLHAVWGCRIRETGGPDKRTPLSPYNTLKLTVQRKLVIFDLDETLVHATRERLDRAPDFQFEDYGVFVRPHLNSMLEAVAPKFDLAVWSSATKSYVDWVVSRIFGEAVQLKFAWSVDRCVQRVDAKSNGYVYIKDLRKVQGQGYAVERILMVDDSPEKISRQPRSHIQISPFVGAQHDAALLELPAMLARATTIAGVER